MQEELVTFETAKLAKEKGFDIPVRYGVFGNKMKLTENHGWERNKKLELRNWNTSKSNSYSVPTQSLLQRWLREVHNFHITICNTNPGDKVDFKFSMSELYKSDDDDSKKYIVLGSKGTFKTYGEALEKGLQETLTLIP